MALLPKPHGSRWHPETCAPRDQIRALYLTGKSTRQIGKLLGYSATYIGDLCADILRPKSEAIRLAKPAKSKHWRTCRSVARRTMERILGRKLLRHEEVHHRDDDFTNNDPSNLEVMITKQHRHHHNPPNPVPRWLRPKRKAYMKRYLREYAKRSLNGASAKTS